jgi:hypothetical protein
VLVEQRLERQYLRHKRASAATRIAAGERGRRLRARLRKLRAASVQIQRIARGMLARVRAAEMERRNRMGALVTQVFRGGRSLPVHAGGRRHLLLTVLRSGANYSFSGLDLCTAVEYRGMLAEPQLLEWLEQVNRTRPKTEQLRKTSKLVPLLLDSLQLVRPIAAAGLQREEAVWTIVVRARQPG